MRFMLMMIPKGYENAAPDAMPDARMVEVMMRYNESLRQAGILLAQDGLLPPSVGARVTFPGGKPTVTDGPFPDVKEALGGFWIIRVNSKEEAVEWASRCPIVDGATIEVRQIAELSDFPGDIQAVMAEFPELLALDEAKP
jgi:hypothetical protein